YKAWIKHVKDGGIILFDDILQGDEMIQVAKELNIIPLNWLHDSGFGFLIKTK
ncbi:unnamed protein product, partial [marine sediment metagenome]